MGDDAWILDGGALSVDFVNTMRDRWQRVPRETLPTDRSVVAWMRRAGIPVADATADRPRALALRSALEALFEGRAAERQTRLINDESRRAPRPMLVHAAASVTAELSGPLSFDDALGLIAADAVHVIDDLPRARVGVCQHERCGLLFVDASRGGRRQWCSMQRCGNRAKAARFDRRQRASPTA